MKNNILLNPFLFSLLFLCHLFTDAVAQEVNLSEVQTVQPIQLLRLVGSEFKDSDLVSIKSVGFIKGLIIYLPARKKALNTGGIPPLQYLITLKKYADSGIADSQYEYASELFLGEILRTSRGLDNAALAYALKAAEKGNVDAKILALKMLYLGRGVPKSNPVLALKQLELIALAGNNDATEAIADLKAEEKAFLSGLRNTKPMMFDPGNLIFNGISYCSTQEKKSNLTPRNLWIIEPKLIICGSI